MVLISSELTARAHYWMLSQQTSTNTQGQRVETSAYIPKSRIMVELLNGQATQIREHLDPFVHCHMKVARPTRRLTLSRSPTNRVHWRRACPAA
jgi:hypothetical protein